MAGIDHGDKWWRFATCSCWPLRGRHPYAPVCMVWTRWLQKSLEQPGQGEHCFYSKQVIGVRIVYRLIRTEQIHNSIYFHFCLGQIRFDCFSTWNWRQVSDSVVFSLSFSMINREQFQTQWPTIRFFLNLKIYCWNSLRLTIHTDFEFGWEQFLCFYFFLHNSPELL